MDFPKSLVFVLFAFILVVLVYSVYVNKSTIQKTPLSKPFSDSNYQNTSFDNLECQNGTNRTCLSGSCQGSQLCKNNQWVECHVFQTCVPGSQTSCIENACANGYKVCNECGTGYGSCVNNS